MAQEGTRTLEEIMKSVADVNAQAAELNSLTRKFHDMKDSVEKDACEFVENMYGIKAGDRIRISVNDAYRNAMKEDGMTSVKDEIEMVVDPGECIKPVWTSSCLCNFFGFFLDPTKTDKAYVKMVIGGHYIKGNRTLRTHHSVEIRVFLDDPEGTNPTITKL